MVRQMVWACASLLMAVPLCAQSAVQSKPWGAGPDGKPVELFTLSDSGITVTLTNYGARIVSIEAPDRAGNDADIVLGYNNLAQYVNDPKDYFGATVGRYGNRIAHGAFSLDGQTYHVPLNNNGNALHGGTEGFSSKVWQAKIVGPRSVEFTLVSPDGDMGFPGTLTAHVRFMLEGKHLRLNYSATTTRTTVINLTNHAYFNLDGEGSGTILGQRLRLDADRITPVAAGLIPTGALQPVAGTPFDFRKATPIGERIEANNEQLKLAGGYDHNFVLNGAAGTLHGAAYAEDPVSGRTLTIQTTEPGVQFYSGNFLSGAVTGTSGHPYKQHDGFALETQHFPDSPNQPSFPSTTLRPGQQWHSTTVLTFGVAPKT